MPKIEVNVPPKILRLIRARQAKGGDDAGAVEAFLAEYAQRVAQMERLRSEALKLDIRNEDLLNGLGFSGQLVAIP